MLDLVVDKDCLTYEKAIDAIKPCLSLTSFFGVGEIKTGSHPIFCGKDLDVKDVTTYHFVRRTYTSYKLGALVTSQSDFDMTKMGIFDRFFGVS
jgi:hypothetical protein